MNGENPFSSPIEPTDVEPSQSLVVAFRILFVDLLGYGTLVAFSLFLSFAAKRYHSIYGWAHRPEHNISPEQFRQTANLANNAILLVVAVAIYFAARCKNQTGKVMGGICVATCFAIFIEGCGTVSVRF